MIKPVYKRFGILFIIPAIFLYIHVWKDYSNNIKNIAEPMIDNVLIFKEKYGRYPTNLDENIKLLKSSGCNIRTESRYEHEHTMVFKCKSIIKDMLVNAVVTELTTAYHLSFHKGYTRCTISLDGSDRTNIFCRQNAFFKLNWNA